MNQKRHYLALIVGALMLHGVTNCLGDGNKEDWEKPPWAPYEGEGLFVEVPAFYGWMPPFLVVYNTVPFVLVMPTYFIPVPGDRWRKAWADSVTFVVKGVCTGIGQVGYLALGAPSYTVKKLFWDCPGHVLWPHAETKTHTEPGSRTTKPRPLSEDGGKSTNQHQTELEQPACADPAGPGSAQP